MQRVLLLAPTCYDKISRKQREKERLQKVPDFILIANGTMQNSFLLLFYYVYIAECS